MSNSSVFLVPEDEMSADDIFGVAVSYANAARIIEHNRAHNEDPMLLFPAMTCAAFALELLAKFFVFKSIGSNSKKEEIKGHKINELWSKIKPDFQDIVIGMHNNKTGEPFTNALDRRREVFEDTLNELVLSGRYGHAQPFFDWRYPYELTEMKFMALQPVLDVMEAFGQAAQYVNNQKNNEKVSK